MPFAVEQIEVFHPLQAKGYAYVKAAVKAAAGAQRFHVAILDEAGQVCAKLHEVTLKELKDPLQHFFYYPRWIPAPLAAACKAESSGASGEKDKRQGEAKTVLKQGDKKTVLIVYSESGVTLGKALARAHAQDEVMEIKISSQKPE